jgi:DNA-binding NtrC family response regulator
MSEQILFIDDNEELRILLPVLLKSHLDVDCLCLKSVAELHAHHRKALASRVAILDFNLGKDEPNGLDAYNWLKANNFKGKIVFLTGHARSHPIIADSDQTGAEIWPKPIRTEQMVKKLTEIMSA